MFNGPALQESFPDARRLIEAGEMIPDTLVGDLLLEALLLDEPGLQDDLGFVVDGFPRTSCQVGSETSMTCDAIHNRHSTCCCGCIRCCESTFGALSAHRMYHGLLMYMSVFCYHVEVWVCVLFRLTS